MAEFLPEELDVRADGDAHLEVTSFDSFLVPSCRCGGVWKPRVVFFGGALEETVKAKAEDEARRCSGMLVMGSSVQVYSAFSFVKLASKAPLGLSKWASEQAGKPVAIVNIGATRADDMASLRLESRCGEVLQELCRMSEKGGVESGKEWLLWPPGSRAVVQEAQQLLRVTRATGQSSMT